MSNNMAGTVGPLDRIKEEICSQLQAEIQSGFAALAVKLSQEIQFLSSQGVKQVLHEDDDITTISGKQQDSVLQGAFPIHSNGNSNDARTPSKYEISQSILVGQDLQMTDIAHEDSSVTGANDCMHPFRKSVTSDIHKHNKTITHHLGSVMVDIKRHSLKESKFPDNCLVRAVLSSCFTGMSFFMIVMNACWMAFESDNPIHQQNDGQRTWRFSVNYSFAAWFAVEVILKIAALRKYFIFGRDWKWNLLDLMFVMTSSPELFEDKQGAYTRSVRMLKLMRAFRLIRLAKFFPSLREILNSLVFTLGSLFWSFVALALTVFIFALLFMQWFALQEESGVLYGSDVIGRFSSTGNAMVTLFSLISGGAEWYDIAQDLDQQSDIYGQMSLMFYVFFTLFGLINVITGVFVARSAEASRTDELLRAREREKVKVLMRIFDEIDTDHAGHIDQEKFHAYFEDYNTHCMLQSHGLHLFDLQELWHTMDCYVGSSDGLVDLPGFVMGVMRLSGDAKSTELLMLSMRVGEIQTTLRRNQSKFDKFLCELTAAQLKCSPIKGSTSVGSTQQSTLLRV